jgi:putative hemolysin
MLKRDELANPESCLNKAHDLEPLFVLRANDETAAANVAAWARDYIVAKGGWGNMTQEQQKKYSEAMHIAGDMRIWQMHKAQRGHAL